MSNQEFLAQFEELKMSVASGFASVNNRFDTIEKRLDTMDNRLDTLEMVLILFLINFHSLMQDLKTPGRILTMF